MITQPIYSRRFVGRDAELELLVGTAQAAAGGPLRSVVITGEAGAGKSRLLREFAQHPALKKFRVVRGRCFDYVRSPYGPIEEIFRSLDAAEPKVLQRDADLRETLEQFFTGGDATVEAVNFRKRRAFNAVVELARRYSIIRPTVMLFEDLHWADAGTLELLEYLAATFEGTQLTLALTLRPDEPDEAERMQQFLARFERQPLLSKLRLEALDEAASLEMIDSALDNGRDLSFERRREIARIAGGVPLYVEEFLKNSLDGSALDLTGNLRAILSERLETLTEEERRVLQFAALLGRFEAQLLATIANSNVDDVLTILNRAHALNIVRERKSDGRFEFRHELLRRAITDDILEPERRRLHRSIAEILERLDAERFSQELASHWWESDAPERAQPYNKAAGDKAMAQYAFSDAIVYFSRALDANTNASMAASIADRLAEAYRLTQHVALEARTLRFLLQVLEGAHDVDASAKIALRLANNRYRALEFGESLDALRLAQLHRSKVTDPAVLFEIAAWDVWYSAHHAQDAEAAIQRANAALPYEPSATPATRADFHSAFAHAQLLCGNIDKGIAAYRHAVALARLSNDPFRIAYHLTAFADDSLSLNASEALNLYREALQIGAELRATDSSIFARAGLAYAQWITGDLRGAAESARDVLITAGEFDFVRASAAIVGAEVAIELGDETLLELSTDPDLLERTRTHAAVFGELARIHSDLDMARGNAASARGRLAAFVRSLKAASYNERSLLRIAQWNLSELFDHAEALLKNNIAAGEQGGAFYALFRATLSTGSSREQAAREAAERFRKIGWLMDEAAALELFDSSAALAAYEAFGAVNALRRLSKGTTSPTSEVDALTFRETEIATLAAQGHTNRSIADRLVLSDRTVENHLTSIFSKLGVKSRVELAGKWKRRESS